MTKKELIEMLSQYPDDMRIVINGYEGGYNDINECEELELVLNYNDISNWESSIYGAHEQKEYARGNTKGKEIAPALYLY